MTSRENPPSSETTADSPPLPPPPRPLASTFVSSVSPTSIHFVYILQYPLPAYLEILPSSCALIRSTPSDCARKPATSAIPRVTERSSGRIQSEPVELRDQSQFLDLSLPYQHGTQRDERPYAYAHAIGGLGGRLGRHSLGVESGGVGRCALIFLFLSSAWTSWRLDFGLWTSDIGFVSGLPC